MWKNWKTELSRRNNFVLPQKKKVLKKLIVEMGVNLYVNTRRNGYSFATGVSGAKV